MPEMLDNLGSLKDETRKQNGATEFSLTFTKEDADKLATCFDGLFKAYGLQVRPVANLWLDKLSNAMKEQP